MAELNDDLLQQLEEGAASMVLTGSAEGDIIEIDSGEQMGSQELVEEIVSGEGSDLNQEETHEETHDVSEAVDANVDSVDDLITLHAVDSQEELMEEGEQMGIQMEQIMDTGNIVEEVITTGHSQDQDDPLLERQSFLNVEEAVFNPETGTLQPVSSINTQQSSTDFQEAKLASPKKSTPKQVKYIIAQPQNDHSGSQGGQILLDASQLQGLMNSGIMKTSGQNIIFSGGKKTMKSPTKILPAPVPVGDQQQPSSSPRFMMKQGSVLTPISGIPGGKVLQIGSGNQIRYVQLVPKKNIVPSNKIPIAPAKPRVAPKPQGQTILLPSGEIGMHSQNLSNFVVLPSNFMVKQENASSSTPIRQVSLQEQMETSAMAAVNQQGQYESFRSLLEPNGMRPRKPCNCTKSQCLKLYCDCFANGEFCHLCNCTGCANNLAHEEDRQKAIKLVLERNPGAFRPKIGKSSSTGEAHERRHNKGCNCRRSGCLKNYCECYEAKIFCSGICKCSGCKNCIENIPTGLPNGVGVEQHFAGAGTSHRQTLKDLAEAAEVRVQQQNQVKNKMRAQMQEVIPQNNLGVMVPPLVFRYPQGSISYEVVTSTVELLLAKAEAAEKQKLPEGEIERVILEEFGDCLSAVMELGSTIDNA